MTQPEITEQVTKYVAFARLWHQLQRSHTDSELNYLMVEITEIEAMILDHYGLPLTLQYSEILQEIGLNEDFHLKDVPVCIAKLQNAAQRYFQEPVLTDLGWLVKAQTEKLQIDNVLPELTLKLQPTLYYIYTYEELLLKEKTSPENYLQELKTIAENECGEMIYQLVQTVSGEWQQHADYVFLKGLGLQYLDNFLVHQMAYFGEPITQA